MGSEDIVVSPKEPSVGKNVKNKGPEKNTIKPLTLRSLIQQNITHGEVEKQLDSSFNITNVPVGEEMNTDTNNEQSPLGEGTIDLENIPIEEVFKKLQCTSEGLTSQEAEFRIKLVGPNKLEEQKENSFLKFMNFMWNPLSWVMELAALMALVLDNGENLAPDWRDFVGIICLLLINSTVSYIEETNAGEAAAALMQALALKAKVLRDKVYVEVDASILVPGDIILIKLGDIIPADARLLEGDPLSVDQSALTGESVAVTKRTGDEVFSGSICKQGELEAVVIATGVHTFFGKAAHLVDTTHQQGHFHQVLKSIGNFCIITIALGMFVEIIVMYPVQKRKYRVGIENLLILLIGGIPIAMPTVLSVTMAVGSHSLVKQGAIVKRMTAIEEMAGMDILCSDKTGTLTLNRLTVDKNAIEVIDQTVDKETILLTAARASRVENQVLSLKYLVHNLYLSTEIFILIFVFLYFFLMNEFVFLFTSIVLYNLLKNFKIIVLLTL